jgi:hypothetical protein
MLYKKCIQSSCKDNKKEEQKKNLPSVALFRKHSSSYFRFHSAASSNALAFPSAAALRAFATAAIGHKFN